MATGPKIVIKYYICGIMTIFGTKLRNWCAVLVAALPALYAETGAASGFYRPEVVEFSSPDELAVWESQGAQIWRTRENMALVLFPDGSGSQENERGNVKENPLRGSRRAVPAMDVARARFGADRMESGEGLPMPYTGNGVVVGFCDTGFDPNHVAFRNAKGESRVRLLTHYNEAEGMRTRLETPAEIAGWTTDNPHDGHATHVAGIMAGSWEGNGYRGMAPDADIVASTSLLSDVGILMGIEDIIDYARSIGKPVVVNLSVSVYNGPRDCSVLFNRWLDLCGEEAVICIAAGNEGNTGCSHRMVFSETQRDWKVRLQSTDWMSFHLEGMTDAWSVDTHSTGISVGVFDEVSNSIVWESEVFGAVQPAAFDMEAASCPGLGEYFNSGTVRIECGPDRANGRWHASASYMLNTNDGNPAGDYRWARYNLVLGFHGTPGTEIWINTDAQYSKAVFLPGYGTMNNRMSINDMCAAPNTVCVGMYNNKGSYMSVGSGEIGLGWEEGFVNGASSFGMLPDGTVLPHTVAPGAGVVSAWSRWHVEAYPSWNPIMAAVAEAGGRLNHWMITSGTSMSTPYVAGCIAAWLEANPTLGTEELKEIISASNRSDYPDPENPRHGCGWFDPYEGMLTVVKSSAGAGGTMSDGEPAFALAGRKLTFLNPSGEKTMVRVCSIDGRVWIDAVSKDAVTELDLSPLPEGIYIATGLCRGKVKSCKIILK